MARQRSGTPPQDLPPSGNEFRQGEIVKATLRPGKYPGETIAEPSQGKRTPPFVVIEKIPPGYFPGEEVEIKIVFASPRRAAGEVVGPEGVVREIQKQLDEGLTKSEKYWKENLLTGPLHIKSDRIQKREKRDAPPRFEYEFQDTRDGHFPLKVFIPNLPADWDPKTAATTEILVKSIEIHNRDKRLFGEAWATAFPEPKISPEQEARKYVKELLGEIRDPKGANTLETPLVDAKADIVKIDGRWVVPDIGEVLNHAEVRFDVPKDWSPDKLIADPVVYEMVDARAEGSKILVRCRIQGVEPGPKIEEVVAAPETKKAEAKTEVTAAKGFGKVLGDALKGMATPDINAALEPLLTELDSPELADLKGLRRRLAVVDEILEQIGQIRAHLITLGATDDAALMSLPRLLEQKKKVEAERRRVDKAIMDAREVWDETIQEIKRDMDAPRTARQERLDKLRSMVEAAAELRVYKRVNGDVDLGPGILDIEDVGEVKRLQAENALVLKQKEEFVYDGTWPEKPGDPDYRLSEMAEDFLVAERLVPYFADRIAELERIAAGGPAPILPPPPPPDLGLPGPLNVPVVADTGTPTEVEAAEELSTDEMGTWLRREGFGTGEFVGLTTASRRRLERLFGTTGNLPDLLRIRNFSIPLDEVEFDLPDGTTGSVSIEQMYRMEQEMARFAQAVEAEGLVTNSLVELADEAVVTLLRPRMERWIVENAGKAIPNKARIEGVDILSGEVALDVEGASSAGVVRVPLEEVNNLVRAKKIKVLKTVAPLEAGGREARLGPVRPVAPAERLLSAEVVAGQVWRYDGSPSKHLNPGGNFRIDSVDDEKGVVRIVTAKEEAAAGRERRPAQKFLVTRDQWNGLPKTFVKGPQAETRGGAVTPEGDEERLLREIEVGQIYAYEGPDAYPFKPNDRFNITALDAVNKLVSFVIAREAEAASVKRTKPTVYKLKLSQWKLIKKRLLSGGSTPPPPSSGPLGGGPSRPPAPPPPESPSRRPTIFPVEEEPELSDVFGRFERNRPDLTSDVPIPPESTSGFPNPMEPTGGFAPIRPAAPRAVPPPPPPERSVVEASYPPRPAGQLEVPPSLSALVDLIRDRDLVNLAKREVKKRAGVLGGLVSVFVGDPFGDITKRIERIATDSGAALTVNHTLRGRLAGVEFSSEVRSAEEELVEAEEVYRRTEAEVLKYTVDQFNALLSGKKVGTDEERTAALERVKKALKRLQVANETARQVLEPPASPSGARRTRRSS